MIINNLKELNKRKVLEYEDIVIFNVLGEEIKYEIRPDFSSLIQKNDHISNDYIFKKLKLEKMKLATECYGYKPVRGEEPTNFPEYETDDYKALTRLIKRLYEIIEERFPEPIIEPITNRFEILDIR